MSMRLAAVGLVTLGLPLVACGSGGSSSSADATTTVASSTSGGSPSSTSSTGSGGSVDTTRCRQVFLDFGKTMAGSTDPQTVADELRAMVPADLRDDVDAYMNAMKDVAALMKAHNGDINNPDVRAALTKLATSKDYQQSSKALTDWMSKGCPAG